MNQKQKMIVVLFHEYEGQGLTTLDKNERILYGVIDIPDWELVSKRDDDGSWSESPPFGEREHCCFTTLSLSLQLSFGEPFVDVGHGRLEALFFLLVLLRFLHLCTVWVGISTQEQALLIHNCPGETSVGG